MPDASTFYGAAAGGAGLDAAGGGPAQQHQYAGMPFNYPYYPQYGPYGGQFGMPPYYMQQQAQQQALQQQPGQGAGAQQAGQGGQPGKQPKFAQQPQLMQPYQGVSGTLVW